MHCIFPRACARPRTKNGLHVYIDFRITWQFASDFAGQSGVSQPFVGVGAMPVYDTAFAFAPALRRSGASNELFGIVVLVVKSPRSLAHQHKMHLCRWGWLGG